MEVGEAIVPGLGEANALANAVRGGCRIQLDCVARRSVTTKALRGSAGGDSRGDSGITDMSVEMGRASGSMKPKPASVTCGETLIVVEARAVPDESPTVDPTSRETY